jgi:hypothetical protein
MQRTKVGPRPRPVLVLVGSALIAAMVAFAFTASGGAGTHRATPASVAPRAIADPVPLGLYKEAAPHVASSLLITGVQGGVQGAPSVPPPDAPPVPPSAFAQPVAQYIAYSKA